MFDDSSIAHIILNTTTRLKLKLYVYITCEVSLVTSFWEMEQERREAYDTQENENIVRIIKVLLKNW